jgi:iturin family lipopeptide synthetase B
MRYIHISVLRQKRQKTCRKNRNQISKFDITIFVEKREDRIFFEIEYARKLFLKETMEKLAKDFLFILDTVSSDRAIKLEGIEIEGLVVENTEIEKVTFNFSD